MQCKMDLPGAIEQHKVIQNDIFNSYKYSSKCCVFLQIIPELFVRLPKKIPLLSSNKKRKSHHNRFSCL